DHGLGDDAGRRDGTDVRALVMGTGVLAGGGVHGLQGAGYGGDRLHAGADPDHSPGAHAALDAPGTVRGAQRVAVLAADDLVMGRRATAGRGGEAVPNLDALDGLDAHQGTGQPGVQATVPVDVAAQAHGHTVGQDL